MDSSNLVSGESVHSTNVEFAKSLLMQPIPEAAGADLAKESLMGSSVPQRPQNTAGNRYMNTQANELIGS